MKKTVRKNIKRQKFYEGELRGNARGFAFLLREDGGDFFVPHRSLNGAQHGDYVKARLVKGDEAEVVAVLKRGINRLVGTLEKNRRGAYVVSDNANYYSEIFINDGSADMVRRSAKVLVEIADYGKTGNPRGRIVEIFGQSGERNAEVLSILFNNGFNSKFAKNTLLEAERLSEDFDCASRVDYRDKLAITIDGEDAKDFDDAISVEKEGDGYILYVHIADVSHYVKEGSELDREAYKRGTSVYFPDTVFPMLPERLSNDLCSLKPNEDKPTLTLKLSFDGDGQMTTFQAEQSVIRSAERMSYRTVQELLDGNDRMQRYTHIIDMLKLSQELAAKLKAKRVMRGSIDFATAEAKVILKNGSVRRIEPYIYRESNGIIEEFMIAANEAVASFLEKRGYPCLYRVHLPPVPEKLEAFEAYAAGFGLTAEKERLNAANLSTFIKSCEATEYRKLIGEAAARTMQKAEYRAVNIGHYGLASSSYCHFTAPIRRYPDLVVHRALKLAILDTDKEKKTRMQKTFPKIAERCSLTERAAERAEREVIDYYKAIFMERHIGEIMEGVISGVTSYAVYVMLDNLVEGMLPESALPSDRYGYDPIRFTLIGIRHSFGLGERLKVRVVAADANTRKVTFGYAGRL